MQQRTYFGLTRKPLLFALSVIVVFIATNIKPFFEQDIQETISIPVDNLGSVSNLDLKPSGKDYPIFRVVSPTDGLAKLMVLFPRGIKGGVLEVELDKKTAFWRSRYYMRLLTSEESEDGKRLISKAVNLSNNRWLPIRPNQYTYRIPLTGKERTGHAILQIRFPGAEPAIPITSITLKPLRFLDTQLGAFLLALLVAAAVFLPGVIVTAFARLSASMPIPITYFVFSILIHLLALLVFKILGFSYLASLTIGVILITFSARYVSGIAQDRQGNAPALYSDDNKVFILLIVLTCVFMAFSNHSAVFNTHWGHLAGERNFWTFWAHDSLFQYVNALAVLTGDFAQYYGTEQAKTLLYMPQDREILPGLLFASLIKTLDLVLPYQIAESFYVYTVFYLLCHVLAILVIFHCLSIIDRRLAYAGVLVLLTSPFYWFLSSIGWFKLTGAALSISAVIVIAKKPEHWRSWVLAGALLGIASNFHGSAALAYPILVLWLLWYVRRQVSVITLIMRAAVLTIIACSLILPWSIYTNTVWDVGTHRLLSQHFLDSHFVEGSLFESANRFFSVYPFSDTLDVRFDRMRSVFSFSDVFSGVADLQLRQPTLPAANLWMMVVAKYLLPLMFPLLIVLMIIWLSAEQTKKGVKKPASWLVQLGLVCVAISLFIAFASFNTNGYSLSAGAIGHMPAMLPVGIMMACMAWSYRFRQDAFRYWNGLACVQLGLLIAFA